MKSLLMAVATGCLLAMSGCSQPYGMGGRGYDCGACGQGMGAGMMAGDGWDHGYRQGRYGMSPGMMGGFGRAGLELTSEQRAKIAEIQTEFSRKQGALMAQMHALGGRSSEVYRDGPFDEQAARKAHDARTGLRQQMFENALEARKRIDSVLSPQQREQLRRRAGGS